MNIGKTKVTPPSHAVDDYAESARLVGPLAAFLVVNVSSPNTPGLRDLQAVESLRPILAAVRAETTTPVLVKIAPDLSDADVDEIADLAVELGLAGHRRHQHHRVARRARHPGCGRTGRGRHLRSARRAAIRRGAASALPDGSVTNWCSISVGGIETADDAWDRITSGASLVQGYTGFVYGGGLWAKHIHDGLARRLRDGGFASLADAVGSAAR